MHKFFIYYYFFGGFVLAALVVLFHEIEGGCLKYLSEDQLRLLYHDYIKYIGDIGFFGDRVSVMDFYKANKVYYDSKQAS